MLARIPFAEDLVAAYYCALDRDTPGYVRAVLFGALAYFVLPIDVVPDFLAGLGLHRRRLGDRGGDRRGRPPSRAQASRAGAPQARAAGPLICGSGPVARAAPTEDWPRTVAEFEAWHARQPERWEFIDGFPRLMAPGSLNHTIIKTNAGFALRQALQGRGTALIASADRDGRHLGHSGRRRDLRAARPFEPCDRRSRRSSSR